MPMAMCGSSYRWRQTVAHKVVFAYCMGCRAPRALPEGRGPFCKLCVMMGEQDKWFKVNRRYLTGGKADIKAGG